MICARNEDSIHRKDTCRGDSGGPLVVLNGDDEYVLAGIVSFEIDPCGDGAPSAYTRVSA